METFNETLIESAGYLGSVPGACGAYVGIFIFWFALISPVVIYTAGNVWGTLTDSRPGNTLIPLLTSILLGIIQFGLIHGCADPISQGGYTDELARTALTVLLNYFVAFSGQNLLIGRNRPKPSADGEKRRGWIDPW